MRPRNPKEVYDLLCTTYEDLCSDEALTTIDWYHPQSFIYTREQVSYIEKELGNFRLPSEEIRKNSANWYYRKAENWIDYAINRNEDTENLQAEKKLLEIRYRRCL